LLFACWLRKRSRRMDATALKASPVRWEMKRGGRYSANSPRSFAMVATRIFECA
jgi:hypothetical protein